MKRNFVDLLLWLKLITISDHKWKHNHRSIIENHSSQILNKNPTQIIPNEMNLFLLEVT